MSKRTKSIMKQQQQQQQEQQQHQLPHTNSGNNKSRGSKKLNSINENREFNRNENVSKNRKYKSSNDKFKKNDKILVLDLNDNKWYKSTVIAVQSNKIKIHYDGCFETLDEWIDETHYLQRIKRRNNNTINVHHIKTKYDSVKDLGSAQDVKSSNLRRNIQTTFDESNYSLNLQLFQRQEQQISDLEKELKESERKREQLQLQIATKLSMIDKLKKETIELNKALKQKPKNEQTYQRHAILSYSSKNRQSINARNDIGKQQETINNIFSEHNKNMTNWMMFTQKMNNNYNKCKNNMKNKEKTKEINPSILLSPYIQCKSLWQQQQNQMESIADITKKLTLQKQQLKGYVTNHNKTASNKKKKYDDELNEYNQTKQKREKLERELKNKLKKLNNKCDQENKLNENQCKLFNEYNTLDVELNEYNLLHENCNNLMKGYRVFDSENDSAINEMQTYFENKWIECMKKWWKWDAESIICWIKYLIERKQLMLSNEIKLDEILKQMNNDKVDGNSLLKIDKDELKSIGFGILSDRREIFNKIQQLISKYPNPSTYGDEGKNNDDNTKEEQFKIPNQFKCPLSGEIMKNPVLIFDGETYEKSQIEQYLNKYKKSPTTKQECDDDDIWYTPNRKLKQKINAFLSVNPQFQ